MAAAVEDMPPAPATAAATQPEHVPAESMMPPQRQSHKSWRRKYYKMRHDFQRRLAGNNKLFEGEQKELRMARRLQEQNDQLLDQLYDINRAPRLPSRLRYDIRSPVPSTSNPLSSLDDDLLELEETLPFNPIRALSRLETIPHSSFSDLPHEPVLRKSLEDYFSVDDEPTGYLSPAHEEEYLAAIDTHEPNALNENTNRISVPSGPWSARDPSVAAAKNPVSVYNWLKKHNPDLLEQTEKGGGGGRDGGGTGASGLGAKDEKATPKAAPTKVMPKRASVGAKHEYGELLDDDGTVINGGKEEATPSGSGRGRKRALVDDDGAYRPKGGSARKKKQKMSIGEKGSGPAAVAGANDGAEPSAEL